MQADTCHTARREHGRPEAGSEDSGTLTLTIVSKALLLTPLATHEHVVSAVMTTLLTQLGKPPA